MENDSETTQEEGGNRTLMGIKYLATKTLKGVVKGGLIGGLALGALAAIPGGGIEMLGHIPFVGSFVDGTGWQLIGSAVSTGAMAGGSVGGALALANGVSNVEEAIDDEVQANVTKDMRRRQLAANQEMMQMNLERMRASQQGMAMSPQTHGLGGMGMKQGGIQVG